MMACQIAGKVQVDILHGHHLCVAAAGSAALYAHAGPQGRLTQAGNRILAHLLQCLCQTDGNGCFAFACGGRVHRCYQNQLCIGVIFDFVVIFAADFALVFAVAIYIFFGNPCFSATFRICSMLHSCAICKSVLNIRKISSLLWRYSAVPHLIQGTVRFFYRKFSIKKRRIPIPNASSPRRSAFE